MYSFLISLAFLIAGYFIYGAFINRLFAPDSSRPTPAVTNADGVDFVPLKPWKAFLIQFLNIAGTGPIFGAIMGAMFGPACFIWIAVGCVFGGAVHDFSSGVISMRCGGQSVPRIIGISLGDTVRKIMVLMTLMLLMFLGPVYVFSPVTIISNASYAVNMGEVASIVCLVAIFLYYIIGTILPIDKVIGRIYPLFGFMMLFMAVSLMVCLIGKWPDIPEFWDGLQNRGPSVGLDDQPMFPCLFVTVACGAISGFHSTQSPMMARCITDEKYARPIFYGAMIAEGVVALIWAAVSSWFFFDGGMSEVGATATSAPNVVVSVSKSWLGPLGGFLAIIGVVVAPLTSGDTAFRSARLIIAEEINLDQTRIVDRLKISIPMFMLAISVVWFNLTETDGFNIIWRYFGLSNQALACVVLWSVSVFLVKRKHNYSFLISFIPACFMTGVCVTFLCVDKTCFGLDSSIVPGVCGIVLAFCLGAFFVIHHKYIYKCV